MPQQHYRRWGKPRVRTGGSHSRCGCRTIRAASPRPPVCVLIATLTELSRIALLPYACDISSIVHHITRKSRSFLLPIFRSGDSQVHRKSAYKNENIPFKITVFWAVTPCSFVYRYLGLSNKLHGVTSQMTVILAVNGAWTQHLTLSFDCSRGTKHNYCQA
jgi:hypothetical protein